MKKMIYRCVSGDTWDSIALALYGSESKATELMQVNPTKCLITVFNGGEEVLLPSNLKLTYGQEQNRETAYMPASAPWKEG